MLLLEGIKIKKYFGDRLILEVEDFKIYATDRIGIVGANGVGKTTLLKILCQEIKPDEGVINLLGSLSYITQLQEPKVKEISKELASKFGVKSQYEETMSGGEKTRFKLAQALTSHSHLLCGDEPTSNLDLEGIALLESSLEKFKGGLLLVSHDRHLLNRVCNKILEVKDGKIKIYHGNYDDYLLQMKLEEERAQFQYHQYIKEKTRLEEALEETKGKSKKIKKTPKRMGNSEARLHKMGNQKAKANFDKVAKGIKSRIEQLEVKEKPKEQVSIKLDLQAGDKLYSKVLVQGEKVNKAFGDRIIFNDAAFTIVNGKKIALVGPNGCGKTTLLKMIIEEETSIKRAKGAKIGYFSQDIKNLDMKKSLLINLLETSIYNETFVRILLSRMLFTKEDLNKKVHLLSGGERVKASLLKILLQDFNLLILDEPTNYLDIKSLEVIEETLKEYDRSLLFVSHDRKLIESVANQIMTIDHQKIKVFNGGYQEFLKTKNKQLDFNKKELQEELLISQNKLSEILGKLSLPDKKGNLEALDQEYHRLIQKINQLKSMIE
ncbi:ribosomal protection-like ABC-F family protein [Alkaliphilus transvaalensis]|uniref:ribosomal protection-like ABC-F family protein n=1 Tax=Alkaliphilus transvaalensis TaxID=114628 RepID=UPI00054E5C06|nr:ABC-F type ribosomal protection protein [Alkaliphilus transvaalensis]